MVERFVLLSVPAFGELHAINQGDVVAERSLHPEWLPSKSSGPVQKRRYVKSHRSFCTPDKSGALVDLAWPMESSLWNS
jgi:hypothetical protein